MCARSTGCQAIAPGYGFLSENAAFAEQVEAAGLAFLGPTAETMRMFAEKHTARALAQQAQVPVLPGSELLQDEAHALREARRVGLPVLLKATGGGGGIGIYNCRSEEDVCQHFCTAARLGQAAFGACCWISNHICIALTKAHTTYWMLTGNSGVFVEKFVEVRHFVRHTWLDILGWIYLAQYAWLYMLVGLPSE